MWCGSRAMAPGALRLSSLLQALQHSGEQAFMATSSAAVQLMRQNVSEAAEDASGNLQQAAADTQQEQQHLPRRQQQQSSQPDEQRPSSDYQQFLHQVPQVNQQHPTLPRFLPKQVEHALPVLDALKLVQVNARARFPETVEAHIRLKVDPRRGDQMVRGAAVLPYSLGKPITIAVFAEGRDADEAKEAGADIVGSDSLIEDISSSRGKSLKFTACLATPDMMPKLVKLGRILGPKGLMPNPKMGTLTTNIPAAVAELRKGRVEFKMDRTAIVHAPIGKVFFDVMKLYANIGALTAELLALKPEAIKGGLSKYVRSVHVCSSMGKAVPVEVSSLLAAVNTAAAVLAQQSNL